MQNAFYTGFKKMIIHIHQKIISLVMCYNYITILIRVHCPIFLVSFVFSVYILRYLVSWILYCFIYHCKYGQLQSFLAVYHLQLHTMSLSYIMQGDILSIETKLSSLFAYILLVFIIVRLLLSRKTSIASYYTIWLIYYGANF